MDPHTPPPDAARVPASPPAAVIDRRPVLTGALPRHLQTWIMAGLALLILGIILLAGRPTPRAPSVPAPVGPHAAAVPAERIRNYQAQLAAQEARSAELGSLALSPLLPVVPPSAVTGVPQPRSEMAALDDEVRRREITSLFADNVAFSRRGSVTRAVSPGETGPAIPSPSDDLTRRNREEGPETGEGREVATTDAQSRPPALIERGTSKMGSPLTLPEGTAIETVLVHRLDGTFRGPVQVLVTTPVYSPDRQVVAIPAGSRVLGTAAPVEAWGARRLAVTFHRLLWPDGRSVALDAFPGLNQIGETGLHDQVDRHYWQVFGASVAIGAIAGLAQVGSRVGFTQTAFDGARQSAGSELATSTARVLDRYLNVLPTVTIREGHRVVVMLTRDVVVDGTAVGGTVGPRHEGGAP